MIVTCLVFLLGAGAGLFLLLTDGRLIDETLALASLGAPVSDVAPPLSLPSLPPLAPAMADEPAGVDARAGAPAAPSTASPAPDAVRSVARPAVRRVRRAPSSEDGFRRATRVGRSRL